MSFLAELRIADLLRSPVAGAEVAALVATSQHTAWVKAGHLLIIPDDRTWKLLRDAAARGDARKATLRCARCGVTGYLWEWYRLCAEGAGGYRVLRVHEGANQGARLHAMAHRCTGDQVAAQIREWIGAALIAKGRAEGAG